MGGVVDDDVMRGTTPDEVPHRAEAPCEDLVQAHTESHTETKSSREDLAAIGKSGTKLPAKVGRPRSVDRVAILKQVCRAISKGDSVQEACREAGIRAARLHEWTREDSVLASMYARAREQQAHSLAEHAIAVSRAAYGRDTAGVQAARLEVDTLKWYVSKIAPKLYGERLVVEDEGEKTIRVVFEQAVPPGRQIADGEWELADG